MPSNIKNPSVVIQRNPESTYNYTRRYTKRKLQAVDNIRASPPKTSTEDQNKKVSFLPAEEEQSNQKVVNLDSDDTNTYPENFCKRPLKAQPHLTPNERNADGNLFIVQQEEHMNSRNMQRKDDNLDAAEENGAASSSKTTCTKHVKIYERDTSLPSPILSDGQNHVASVPSGLALPRTTILAGKPFSPRDRIEDTQKAIAKFDSTMDGGRTAAYSAIKIIPKHDEFDSIGQNVAAKLRRLSSEQSIIAEKLIHEVIYEAAMGTLSRGTRLLTPPPCSANWPSMPFPAASNSFNELNMYSRFYGFNNR